MDKVMFWKQSPSDSAPSTPPDYDLGARSFDNQIDPSMHMQQGFGQNMQDPMMHDPIMAQSNQMDSFGSTIQAQDPNNVHFSNQQYPQAQPFPGSSQQYAQQDMQQAHGAEIHPRDVELILAKLDSIKSEIDSLHQRVKKIEQYYDSASSQQSKPSQQRQYW